MKENNLNRVIGWSGLLLTSLLSTSALADNIGTSAEELGLSDYRHFVIYPRLDKALKAQKNNDEATAIREFEYIHQQVPDNILLTLYLAEAYRHFGHDDRARSLAESGSAGISGPARRTTTPGRTKSVSASSINIPLRRLINVTESATTRFSPLECTGKCVSSFSYC